MVKSIPTSEQMRQAIKADQLTLDALTEKGWTGGTALSVLLGSIYSHPMFDDFREVSRRNPQLRHMRALAEGLSGCRHPTDGSRRGKPSERGARI